MSMLMSMSMPTSIYIYCDGKKNNEIISMVDSLG